MEDHRVTQRRLDVGVAARTVPTGPGSTRPRVPG